MKIVRQITYESSIPHYLNQQMERSLADGTHCLLTTITVETVYDERIGGHIAEPGSKRPPSSDPVIDPSRPPSIKDELEAMQESGQS